MADIPMVPPALRAWFVVHGVVDLVVALPLLIVPEWLAARLAWPGLDPFTARLVGAALLAIGLESLLGRATGPEGYRALLTLKVIWAWSATAAIVVSMLERPELPPLGWGIAGIFALFGTAWTYYRLRIGGRG